ncbi:TetR/AcrR family transcriptional regulator [Runella aurantiaca]|uniref:TetR/AcrR family transcriptional regulator n=1 Tax=Runella aurantiaca TaxID=2282308 RepID=A0A369IGF8_9BACT|nr:TetR/AcrR family transcriptional regulator [Runella aurantiaca]RDB06364.1 TetR/AcrR family transcriptional regulator [Runella aurantiaca]
MQNTKEKILWASIKLFNEHGVANVRLQQIADEIGISVGNLAYHYRNKEAIVSSVYDILFEDFGHILSQYLQSPSFADFDRQILLYFEFFKTYQFYITDLFSMEHALPEIKAEWQLFMNKMILQIRTRIDFHINRGELVSETVQGTYNLISESIWMTIVFWIPQQTMRNKPVTETRFRSAVWNHLKPYLTQKGLDTFEFSLPVLSQN